MSKQILYGTVSALALILAAQGAHAQATSTTSTTGNTASKVTVDTSNEVEAFAFKHFSGALQVQQNGSVNSSVSQNMAIDAFKDGSIGLNVSSSATSKNTVSGNSATTATVSAADPEGTDNSLEDAAFKHARGAVQVQQNRSINSSTGQNMDINPVSTPGAGAGAATTTAALTSTVSGNSIDAGDGATSSVSGGNSITDGAFKHAKGAFQVQQNNSINSSTQQNMGVIAENVRGGRAGALPVVEADLTHTVTGNLAIGLTVDGSNTIDAGAFKHAAGAFQVQQSNSANSAVGQNMAIGAEDARAGGGYGGDGRDDDAVSKTSVSANAGGLQDTFPPLVFVPSFATVDTANEIDGGAFKHAKGAFQVQQNGSINSSAGQNMAISAVRQTGAKTDSTIGATATSTNDVFGSTAENANIFSGRIDNDISDGAFKHAKGAFQVQQNRSINSSTGQNMKLSVVSDAGGNISSTLGSTARINDEVGALGVNNLANLAIDGNNAISDGAFKHAAGAFQVQQNNSTESSTQQNMAVVAVKARGGTVSRASASAEADLSEIPAFNFAGFVNVDGSNSIDDAAFKDARGAFQVQQSSSGTSGVGQNMAITAAGNGGGGIGGAGSSDDANAFSDVVGNHSGVSSFPANAASGVSFFFPGAATGPVTIDTDNSIEDFAFKNARGAFQVQQNGSVNSAVYQNMAITALKEQGVPTDANVTSSATSNSFVQANSAVDSHIAGGANTIEDKAFENARGAFQVQQNRSINSAVGENVRIVAIKDPKASIASTISSPATLNSTVGGIDGLANTVSGSNVNGPNTIEDSAFKHAKGAFEVQQNNSINSSVQQNLAITAIKAEGATFGGFNTAELANLSSIVTGNTANNVTVTGFNQIDDRAFEHAAGAFQVQQNSSTNSSVSQNMSIVAISTTGRH